MDTDTSPTSTHPTPPDEDPTPITGATGIAPTTTSPMPMNAEARSRFPRALASTAPPEEPMVVTRTQAPTSPIADAIRGELELLVDVEVLDLDTLAAVASVAAQGRNLLAVQNPTARFDAKAQGLADTPTVVHSAYGLKRRNPHDRYQHWKGPMLQAAAGREAKRVREALSTSPLAKAVQVELRALLNAEPFHGSQLLQIEQLANHTRSILASALGLVDDPYSEIEGCVGGYGGAIYGAPLYPGGNGSMPFSSDETFGARALREMGATSSKDDPEKIVAALAVARKEGMDDVAAKLASKLGVSPDAPAPAPSPVPDVED